MIPMNKGTLSIAPYFGGKGRMAHFIADRLNYDDSSIFVTPFGGMCRVLLNKPRHDLECYNDYNAGLTALMRILSDSERSIELIHRLEDETVYSEEEFNRQKLIYDNATVDLEEQEREKLKRLLIDNDVIPAVTANRLIDEIVYQSLRSFTSEKTKKKAKFKRKQAVHAAINPITTSMKEAFPKLGQVLKDETLQAEYVLHVGNLIELYWHKQDTDFLEQSRDIVEENTSDMDLAIATFVVFQQSRDGIGKTWSAEKFKTNDQYRQQIVKLFDCAERLEGVEVFQIDAMEFFRNMMFVDADTSSSQVPSQFQVLNEWINNPEVMMYCDPSYIKVESESELLKGIDVDSTPCLADAVKEKFKGKKPVNLGRIYAKSFEYDDQEKFLRCIQKAKCRILVSNYDLQLYNKYLNEETGWHREEFHTTTGVGNKRDNKRVEVIWYNY